MIWWVYNSKMLESEEASLKELQGRVSWLKVDKLQANSDLSMCVDFRIVHCEVEYAFQMIYPKVYPDAPPMIYTADRSRISLHQYGASGELCLEYRPDNWHPSITGANMVESCQRLLVEERTEVGEILHARSAHISSLGRDLRSNNLRILLTMADIEALNNLEECKSQHLKLCERLVDETLISSICYIGSKDLPIWTSDLMMPNSNLDHLYKTSIAVRIPGTGKLDPIKPDNLRVLLEEAGLQELGISLFDTNTLHKLLIGDRDNWKLIWNTGESIYTYTTVQIPNNGQRLPVCYDRISEKKVGIVGCGSLGSKVASSLCRSGVRNFLLIDEDIFFPGNIVRNELDLRAAGIHKIIALRDRLINIAPTTKVKTLRMSLGGQESAELMTRALESLGNCDLLVDATADSTAFNLIASVSKRKMKPLVWGQVFSGGIGGLVARSRPNLDPVPLSVRQQILTWYNDQNVEWVGDAGRYEGRGEDDQPLIANDAEVTLIASHITRLAIDILVDPNKSIFPNSVYLIGFSKAWLFNQPFETYPIDLQPYGVWGEVGDKLNIEDKLKLLEKYMPQK